MIGFVALDSPEIGITCWKSNAAQGLLSCSMNAYHFDFVAEDGNGSLISSAELREIADLVKSAGARNFDYQNNLTPKIARSTH